MGTMGNSLTRQVWNTVISLKNGAKFTISELRASHFPSAKYTNMSSAIQHLKLIGVIKPLTAWDGTNHIVYEVVNESKLPVPIKLDHWYSKAKPKMKPKQVRGMGLYRYQEAKKASSTKKLVRENSSIVPLNELSTSELLAEISRRTK